MSIRENSARRTATIPLHGGMNRLTALYTKEEKPCSFYGAASRRCEVFHDEYLEMPVNMIQEGDNKLVYERANQTRQGLQTNIEICFAMLWNRAGLRR